MNTRESDGIRIRGKEYDPGLKGTNKGLKGTNKGLKVKRAYKCGVQVRGTSTRGEGIFNHSAFQFDKPVQNIPAKKKSVNVRLKKRSCKRVG